MTIFYKLFSFYLNIIINYQFLPYSCVTNAKQDQSAEKQSLIYEIIFFVPCITTIIL